jgi:hypothetical protein
MDNLLHGIQGEGLVEHLVGGLLVKAQAGGQPIHAE